jgi:hypothetical protein
MPDVETQLIAFEEAEPQYTDSRQQTIFCTAI